MPQETAVKDSADKILNGVNVDGIFRAIALMSCAPEAAKFKFRNRNEWISGGLNRSFVNGYYGALAEHTRETPFVLDNDEPPRSSRGGQGREPRRAGSPRPRGMHHDDARLPRGGQRHKDRRDGDELRGRPRSQGISGASGCKAKRLRRDKGERQDQVRRREGGDRGAREACRKALASLRHSFESRPGEG